MKSMRWALTIVTAAAPWVAAHAQPTPVQVRSLAANCAQCHGTDGRPPPGSILPALAGRPEAELTASLLAYKAGSMPSTVMTQLAKGFTDAQLRMLAAHFAAQPK